MYFFHTGETSNTTIAQLQNMLRVAARQISALAREKQQLIEMGNRLRAKLQQNGEGDLFSFLYIYIQILK